MINLGKEVKKVTDEEKADNSYPELDTQIRLLQTTIEEDTVHAKLLCEYIDRRNSGEEVDKEELLSRANSTEVRKKLEDDLRFSDFMLDLGKFWREKHGKDTPA